MKFVYRFLFLLLFIVLYSFSALLAQDHTAKVHPYETFRKIDQAYQEGKIDLNKKVLLKFYAGRNSNKLPSEYQPTEAITLKCGTPAITEFQNKKSRLSKSSVTEIESMLQSSRMQASETYQSPSGKFILHYETTGSDAVPVQDTDSDGVPDYVEWTAAAADSSWNHEVANLGYTDPVVGSSNPYKIYIETPYFGSGTYGETHTGSYKNVNDPTIIVINNALDNPDFHVNTAENQTRGAIKVTVAHELKHAIQYEANKWEGETFNWLEMDGTLMEEVVYDDVNDYYNYIQSDISIFNDINHSFYPGSYYHVTWALFFEEKFGSQFWVDVWETIKANPNITMVDAITQQLGGADAFNRNYLESQLWHFASGKNSRLNFGFEERQYYPTPAINNNLFGDDSLTAPDTLSKLSAKYFEVQPSPFPGSIEVNLSNTTNSPTSLGIIAFFSDGSIEHQVIVNTQQKSVTRSTNWQWNQIEKLGIVAGNSSTLQWTKFGFSIRSVDPQMVRIEQNYPNPFRDQTTIRYSIPEQKDVQLEVFDVLGRKVATLINGSQPKGIYTPQFDGSNYASGIYFYRLILDGNVTTKKMTLIK